MRYALIESREYVLPAHWASPLINGDNSGLEDEDIEELTSWLADENDSLPDNQHISCCDVSEETEFLCSCHGPVGDNRSALGGDFATYTFLVYGEER